MKTLKNIFAIAILSVVSLVAVAQPGTNASANITASATVLAPLSITNNSNLGFGKISATTVGAVVVDPKDVANFYIGETYSVGKFTISAAASTSIEIEWPSTITMNDGGTNDIIVTLDVNGNVDNDASTSTDHSNGSPVDVTTSASGKYYLFVGGSIPTLTNQATGTYSGTATFEVLYN